MQQRGVVLVEGTSDRRALETLARRRGRDLQSEGVAVVAMGGYGNLPRLLRQYGGVRLAGLYDVGEERHFLRALGCVDRGELERVGFYACTRDLEDELTRAVGPAEMERVLAEQGELRAFRTYQRQPAHRARPLEEQLHGFMWNRKQRYAVLLVEALDLERIPRPLDRVLACVQLDTARSRTVLDVEAGAWEAGAGAWIARVGASRGEMHDASVRDLLPPPAGLTLDVGCGEGRLTRELASLGYEVVGVDRSAALVEAARQADPSGRYEVAAIDALPIEDGEAQLVLCINVLPHVVDLVGAARELARVLPAGGVLVAGHRHPVAEAATYDEENDELRVRGYFEHEPHAVSLGDGQVFHQHRTIEDYVRTLIGAGFALEDLREVPRAGGSTPAYLDLRLTRR